MCDPLTFSIDHEAYEKLVARAEHEGMLLPGYKGKVDFHHCTFVWEYEPLTQSLTIQCVGKPFFVACGTVNDKLRELVLQS